jgi:small redox-active disulfide protein 2
MKTIKILGTGCAKCKTTEVVVREALAEAGIEAEVIKVEDIQQIMAYDIISTPAVVVDEVVKIKGRVPKKEEIIALL